MNENSKINILVLGSSGAGKSTLIKAISGTEIITGVGKVCFNILVRLII